MKTWKKFRKALRVRFPDLRDPSFLELDKSERRKEGGKSTHLRHQKSSANGHFATLQALAGNGTDVEGVGHETD